jgi:hypothetical protein
MFKIFVCLKPCRNPFQILLYPYRPGCRTLSHPIAWRIMQYTTMINAVLHCGLMQFNVFRTGSIRISIRNLNPCKNFEHDQKDFLGRIVLLESIRNWHGLRYGSIWVEPRLYGFNSVWTRLEIRLCVTAFPECRPQSKLFWPVSTRVDLRLIPDSPAPTPVDPQRQT